MQSSIRWGILGPGIIAHDFARSLKTVQGSSLVAVASRDIDRAQTFARELDVPIVLGSYEALAAHPDVDIVYVATPHTLHMEHTMLCLQHKKHVLCEKPLGLSAAQARQMATCAEDNGVFLMEALRSRFFPVNLQVQKWIREGDIGEVRMVHATFGFRTAWEPKARLLNLELAGGALLDVGVYLLHFACMIYGRAPEDTSGLCYIGETGVDEQDTITLKFAGGAMASLSCSIRTELPPIAYIMGTEGHIEIPHFWRPTQATMIRGVAKTNFEYPSRVRGLEYEIEHVQDCLQKGLLRSPILPVSETIRVLELTDQLRKSWHLRYAAE